MFFASDTDYACVSLPNLNLHFLDKIKSPNFMTASIILYHHHNYGTNYTCKCSSNSIRLTCMYALRVVLEFRVHECTSAD